MTAIRCARETQKWHGFGVSPQIYRPWPLFIFIRSVILFLVELDVLAAKRQSRNRLESNSDVTIGFVSL